MQVHDSNERTLVLCTVESRVELGHARGRLAARPFFLLSVFDKRESLGEKKRFFSDDGR